ncbi:phage portal protein%2C putative%2C A118 family [Blautia hydrogenotrophica]|uniref:phage portal protein n=1 Tax=Blautia hydrogenotrophica TaxID=53443 RepID=UPI0006C0DEC5|nr:phage portal protein [Blautia hydrogenotrophica]CUN17463.1 phage portal protein%2C putative%2C A118 family [Blautia hydrogenotrophica]SCI23140.1 phage portal protein%2C putative%2C A118 family [uncultured Blautia sp.]
MDVVKYLQRAGYTTVQKSFYVKIAEWESWYISNVRKFHRYRIYNGKSYVSCRRLGMGMAKKLSEDIADLLLNEKVQITIQDSSTHEFVTQVLNDNNFWVMGNDYQERKAYTGTVAYIPYLDAIRVSENGEIVDGGTVRINYVSAEDIYPLSWSNGYISECAFVFYKTIETKLYVQIQIHKLQNDQYVIENHVVECTNGAGREVPSEKWKDLKDFSGLSEWVETGSSERQFVVDRLNIVNNYSKDNPMGIAIFANSIDILQGLDTIYDSYINEFVLGKKRIFVAPELLYTDPLGNPAFDPNDVTFYQLPEDTLKDGGKPITEIDMNLRADAHEKGINDNLNFLSVKCGFGQNHYRFDNGSVQTATQIISENSDMFRALKKHEIVLQSALEELIRIIARLGQKMNIPTDPDSKMVIDFDDSIIEDKQAERSTDRTDMSMGILRHEEYRAKWYGETLEEARKNLPEQNQVIE